MISGLEQERIADISAGKFSAAVSVRGALFVWGSGTFGECLSPKKIESKDSLFVSCRVSGHNIGVVDDGGYVWTSGPNESGQLGTGDFLSSDSLNLNSEIQEMACSLIGIGNGFMVAAGIRRDGLGSENSEDEEFLEQIHSTREEFSGIGEGLEARKSIGLQRVSASFKESNYVPSKEITGSLVSFTQQSQNHLITRIYTESRGREEENKKELEISPKE